jgi:nitrogen fixation-related uncharacterized protein
MAPHPESWTNATPATPRGRRMKGIVLLVMSICIIVPSMLGFSAKFLEFIHTFRGTSDGAFAVTPVLNYLLASVGFFCMLLWAAANGMFHDMEEPKHHMLELEEALDRAAGSKGVPQP